MVDFILHTLIILDFVFDAGAADADTDAGIPIGVTVHKVHLSNTLRAAHDTPEMINFEHDQNLIFH